MRAAKAWGLTPERWDRESPYSRAEMMALEEAEARMAAWDDEHPPKR